MRRKPSFGGYLVGKAQPKPVEIALAFLQLSRFIGVGITLDEALDQLSCADDSRHGRYLWRSIALHVSRGRSLSEAITSSALSRERILVPLLKAGEKSSQLDLACQTISNYFYWKHDVQQRLVTLLIYPLFSMLVLLGVTAFLFVSVVPAIKGFLHAANGELAWHTLLLLDVSAWLSQYYTAMFAGLSACVGLLVLMVKQSEPVLHFIHARFLELPLVGKLAIDISLSRYAMCSANLYARGVVLEEALELAEDTVANLAMRMQLKSARLRMVGGESLSVSMQSASILPGFFAKLLQASERSGQLADVLMQIAEHRDSDAQNSIKRIEQMIGPVVLAIVGLVLLWIVLSVLGPVYDLAISTVTGAS